MIDHLSLGPVAPLGRRRRRRREQNLNLNSRPKFRVRLRRAISVALAPGDSRWPRRPAAKFGPPLWFVIVGPLLLCFRRRRRLSLCAPVCLQCRPISCVPVRETRSHCCAPREALTCAPATKMSPARSLARTKRAANNRLLRRDAVAAAAEQTECERASERALCRAGL